MNRLKLAGISIAGGLISSFAWTGWCPGIVLLFSLVPFLLVSDVIARKHPLFSSSDYFFIILPGFLVMNIVTLEWVRAANLVAAAVIIIWLSTLMSLVLWLAHIVRTKAGAAAGYIAFISFWLTFEYISLHTVYLSPWMMLGNGLAREIRLIQWYEYTGSAGGSLWILLSNTLLAAIITGQGRMTLSKVAASVLWLTVIIVPSLISASLFKNIKNSNKQLTEVIVIQPNIDPFSQKYSVPFTIQLEKVLDIAEAAITQDTDWIIAPETVVDDPADEENLKEDPYFNMLNDFARKHFPVNIVAGLASRSTQKDPVSGDSIHQFHNSAFLIDSSAFAKIYHKSKLVAGIEQEFSSAFGRLVELVAPELGGTGWGYVPQKERTVFSHSVKNHKAAPVICYESVFGDFVAEFVRERAGILFIITNDGWWKNTSGYRQHLNYASLRAIETRRQVVRAANTGISCITDIRGKRITETEWWTEGSIVARVSIEDRMTFYVKYGDYILISASALSLFLLLYFTGFLLLKHKKTF